MVSCQPLIWTVLRGQRERLVMNVRLLVTKWIPARRNGWLAPSKSLL
jgi:hypothetical protein